MEMIASGGFDEKIIISDISSGDTIASLEEHTGEVRCVAFSPLGTILVSGSVDGTIIVWDCETWTRIQDFIGHASNVTSLNFNSAGDRIVSTSYDGETRVWSLLTNLEVLRIRTTFTLSASFNSNGDTLAVASYEELALYDGFTGNKLRSLYGHTSSVTSVQFSRRDSAILVSGSDDSTVIIWDATNGERRLLKGHDGRISQVCFNADASRIVSGSWDRTARIWDVSTSECLLIISEPRSILWSCCFSEDGSKVIIAGYDRAIKVWDSATGEELMTVPSHNVVRSVSYRLVSMGSYV